MPFDEELPPEGPVGAFADSRGRTVSSMSACRDIERVSTTDAVLPVDTMASFIQGLLSLDPELRDIVAWRYQGVAYKEIARRQGITTQLAEMRHKRALRDWPALRALFPEKVAKRKRRKSRG